MYFTSPQHENWDNAVVSTDDLQKMVHNNFSFRYNYYNNYCYANITTNITNMSISFMHVNISIHSIPGSINLQTFLHNHCANISQVTRYKVQFKIFAGDASHFVKAGCHIEEQGDTITHIWTRVSVKDKIKDAWQDVRNIDIICPGR